MYAVGIVDGRMPMGNDGLQMLRGKNMKTWLSETDAMRHVNEKVQEGEFGNETGIS